VSATALADDVVRRQWEEMGFSTEAFCRAPRVRPVDTTAGKFVARHSRAYLQLRRLRRAGAEVQVRPPEPRLVREIYRCKAQQINLPDNLFTDPVRVEFGIAAAVMDPFCEVFTVEAGTELVAALLTYRDGHARRLYTTCYSRRWGKYSPGIALLLEAARRSLEQGLECDFLTGEQPHKLRFATTSLPLYTASATAEQLAEVGRTGAELAA
jgi:CelD/BcsL family acetyltransferase involved in cellulose biosynthesis